MTLRNRQAPLTHHAGDGGGILLLFLTISMTLLAVSPTAGTSPSVLSVHRTFWLTGDNYLGWNLTRPGPSLTVTSGDTVTLMLKSYDGLLHQWFIDFNNNLLLDSNETGTASPGFSSASTYANYTFTPIIGVNIPRAGTWTYRCTYHPIFMYATITINQNPDFSISTNPASLTVNLGSSATSTIAVNSTGGFSGTLNLATTVTPSGVSANLSASTVTLAAGESRSITLTMMSSNAGTFKVNVTGSSGSQSHTTTLTVTFLDFSINADPVALALVPGSSATSTITLSSANGFAGTIRVAANVSPSGLASSLNTSTVTLTSTGSASVKLTVTGSTDGAFSVNVTGYSGSLAHSVFLSVTVAEAPDFTLSPNPPSISITQGSTGATVITITSLNGFSGNLQLTATVSPSGPTVGLNPATLTLSPTSPASSTLSVATSASVVPSRYQVMVKATAGSLTHSVTIMILVTKQLVSISPPVFVHRGLAWAHHAQVSRSGGAEHFIALVENQAATPIWVQVVITGTSGAVAFQGESKVVLLQPGKLTVISFSVSTGGLSGRICFSAILQYGLIQTDLANTSPSTRSGCFVVSGHGVFSIPGPASADREILHGAAIRADVDNILP